ncbi:MAG: MFS transporter [Terriglobales bacterium]|jgi:MFS family permease
MQCATDQITVRTDDKDRALSDRAFKKVIIRFLPVMIFAYVIAYIDRTNIGFAALTMNKDLGLSPLEFGWGAGVLFFGYCFCEVPSNALLYRVGARRWLARIMVTWGLTAAAMALVVGPKSFYLARFLLGVAEAGFTPGAMYFFTAWFPVHYRSRLMSWWYMSVPAASLVSGPLSSLIMQMDGVLGLAGWKWLFIAEGVPAVVIGVLLLRILTERPEDANWLTPEERAVVIRTLASEKRERPVTNLWAAMADSRVLVLAAIQLCFGIGSYAVAIWLPLILKGHNLSNFAVGMVAAIPYLFGCIGTVIWANRVDRSGLRIGNLAAACLVGAVGLLVAVRFPTLAMSMVGLSIALIGITSARGIFWSIPPRFLTGLGAAGGLAFINSIGTLGGFFGPVIMGWLKTATGSFAVGLAVMGCFMVVASVLTLGMRLVVRQE